MSLYYLANYRTPEQLADMRRLEAAGICIFCPEHLAADPDQRVVHRTAHWTVTPNEFPYPGTRLHLLLVPHRHVTDVLDLPPEAQADLFAALGWVRDAHGLAGYGLGVRCGDPASTGATIAHVHLHVIVGDPAAEPVRFKMSQPPRPDLEAALRAGRSPAPQP
jgi:diadenosine tetraphosphate (Ap4A) HIT family hydrolase